MGLGLFLVAFIVIIVGLVLFQAIAQTVGSVTSTTSLAVTQYTPAAAGLAIDLPGQELFSVPVVLNDTGSAVDCAANFTIAEGVSPRTGTKRIIMTSDATYDAAVVCSNVNVSYDYAAEGYIDDSGARSVALLIVILTAMAVFSIALIPAFRNGIVDLVKG